MPYDRIQLSIPYDEGAAYRAAAERAGLPLTTWIRQVLRAAVQFPGRPDLFLER